MQTVTWSRIEDWLLSLTGNDSFSTDEKAWIKSAVNRRIRMAYEESPFWPRYINEELRWAGFDNVVPVDQEGKSSIDTLLGTWDSDPRKRISTAQRYESVPRSDGFQILGLADGDYTDVAYTSTISAVTSDLASAENDTVRAISFVLTADAITDYGADTDDRTILVMNGDGDGLASGNSQGGILLTFSSLSSNVRARNTWVEAEGSSMDVYADGRLIGRDFGAGDTGPLIQSYFDGEPHHFLWTLRSSATTDQNLGDIYYELNSDSGQTNDLSLDISDVRVYKNTIDANTALLMAQNPTKIYDQIAWASNLPEYWCSYKSQLTNYYGDGAGETSTVPVEFQEYAVHGAYADWLRMEGQNGKALAEEQFARESLERQLERIYYTSGSPVVSSNFNTHSKSQSR